MSFAQKSIIIDYNTSETSAPKIQSFPPEHQSFPELTAFGAEMTESQKTVFLRRKWLEQKRLGRKWLEAWIFFREIKNEPAEKDFSKL